MKKRILCLVMALTMIVGCSITANAEDFQGASDWKVSFTGDKMESNFESSEMKQEILQILPGDSITLKVSLQNDGEKDTEWYMTNEVLQSLEDSKEAAQGGAYTYILTYVNAAGEETVLFSSEAVGGEGDSEAGEGLHQATNALEDYFYLDQLSTGEAGYVQLVVKLDGETQGNAYQDTLAKLVMNFAVEEVDDDKVYEESAKTGDFAPMMAASAGALVAGIVLLIFAIMLSKRRGVEGE